MIGCRCTCWRRRLHFTHSRRWRRGFAHNSRGRWLQIEWLLMWLRNLRCSLIRRLLLRNLWRKGLRRHRSSIGHSVGHALVPRRRVHSRRHSWWLLERLSLCDFPTELLIDGREMFQSVLNLRKHLLNRLCAYKIADRVLWLRLSLVQYKLLLANGRGDSQQSSHSFGVFGHDEE